MTVAEYIQELQGLPQDATVVYRDKEWDGPSVYLHAAGPPGVIAAVYYKDDATYRGPSKAREAVAVVEVG